MSLMEKDVEDGSKGWVRSNERMKGPRNKCSGEAVRAGDWIRRLRKIFGVERGMEA